MNDTNLLKLSKNRDVRQLALKHIAGWILFIIYELCLIVYTSGSLKNPLSFVYFYVCNILLFYTHLHILKKTFSNGTSHYLRFSILLGAELLIFILLKFFGELILRFHGWPEESQRDLALQYLMMDMFRNINFIMLASLYWTAANLGVYRTKAQEAKLLTAIALADKKEVELKLVKAENAYLQQQLNPHLLFNTLNYIYNSVVPYSQNCAEGVHLLSDIMRYSMEGSETRDQVSLSSELEQVDNLIAICRLRFNHELYLDLYKTGDAAPWYIIPLSLVTLTENIFKHGLVQSPDKPATLRILVDESGHFHYKCFNFKKAGSPHKKTRPIGLHNLKIRLEHVYGSRHQLFIDDQADYFQLDLKIQL